MPLFLAAAAALVLAACGPGREAGGGPHPIASVEVDAGPDSLFHSIQARLRSLGYRVEQADTAGRRLVVRPPGNETRVEIRVEAHGSASRVSTAPADGGDTSAQLPGVLRVMHDVSMEPASARDAPAAPGGLPASRWITELFLSPSGRLWSARTGLFTADSLFGPWRRSFGGRGDPVDPDDLRVGANLGFVSDEVMVLGVGGEGWENRPLLYRTTDGGTSWSAVPAGLFEDVRAIGAVGPSVWVFATRLEGEERAAVFLRSADGGETWERVALPPGLTYADHLYRATRDTAYLANVGFDRELVFWRTTDGGDRWEPIPTPHDQGLHRVPEDGVHVEEIATVGPHLVVREYGRVFYTRTDSIRWRAIDGIEHVAADRARDQLFVLTDQLEPAMLDGSFMFLWRGDRRIPRRRPSNVEAVAAFDGAGYVVMLQGEIYEVRGGTVRLRREGR